VTGGSPWGRPSPPGSERVSSSPSGAVWCAKAGMPLVELQQRLGHATITMTQRYAVYCPPVTSVHYEAALRQMGMGSGEAPDVPTVVPTPRPDEDAASEPEGPEAASRQGGGAGIRTHKPVRAPHFEGRSPDATGTDKNRRKPTLPRLPAKRSPTVTDSSRRGAA
jgi:hypothetical protein